MTATYGDDQEIMRDRPDQQYLWCRVGPVNGTKASRALTVVDHGVPGEASGLPLLVHAIHSSSSTRCAQDVRYDIIDRLLSHIPPRAF